MSDGFSFGELQHLIDSSALVDAETIKDALPVVFVLEQNGVEILEGEAGSSLRAFCPFHDDGENPGLTVFGERLQKVACWSACIQGDVFDLIRKFEPGLTTFPEVADRARRYYADLVAQEWTAPEIMSAPRNPPPDPEFVQSKYARSREDIDYRFVQELIAHKRRKDGQDSNRFDAEWLVDNFGIGTWAGEIIIPYFTTDYAISTYKYRTLEKSPRSLSGQGQFADLVYNQWRTDRLDAPVLIVEGESDTWNAQFEVGDKYRVLGVPTGAGSKLSNQLEWFRGRTVLLALDADGAGRKGVVQLAASLRGVDADVRIVPIPEGKDVSQAAAQLRGLCSRARAIVQAPRGMHVTENGYARPGENLDPISNFVFVAERELRGEDGSVAYEGHLKPGGESVVITSADLSGKNRMVSWAMRNGRAWYGTDRDVSILLGMLQADGVFLPAGQMASTAGLHDRHFVYPGGVIGPDYWTYVPSTNANLEADVHIKPGAWSPDYVHVLRDIQRHAITDPFLAWLAVAPLRSLFYEFPNLAISGSAGGGKTQTAETMLRAFTGTYIAKTLTGTTPYAIMAAVSATNGIPVIFEEYRNGARDDSKALFEQILRDAYTQQPSDKGGMKVDWTAITKIIPSAPLIVSGEGTLSEKSHTDRTIMLYVSKKGRNKVAFDRANRWDNNGLPYAYLTFLHRALMDGDIDVREARPAGPTDLGTRPRTNIGILHYGWKLLQAFMEDVGDYLGAPDFSMVESELREADLHTPIEDAIVWCLGEADAMSFVMQKGPDIWLKVDNFVKHITDKRMFKLPSNDATSIRKHMVENYGAEEKKLTSEDGKLTQTFLVFPYVRVQK